MKTFSVLISSYLLLCTALAQAGQTVSSGDNASKYFACNTLPHVDSSFRIKAIEPEGNHVATTMFFELNGNVKVLDVIFSESRPEGKGLILTFANLGRYSLTIDATALERGAPPAFVPGWYTVFSDTGELVSQEQLLCKYIEGSN